MERHGVETEESVAPIEPTMGQEGLYVYSIALSGEAVNLGAIGIEGREVFGVVGNDLCATVHRCPAEPYQSKSAEVVASWVMTHHRVVDAAWRRWGTVLPLTFNTIIKGDPGRSAEACLLAWLEAGHDTLKAKLEGLAGKAEYSVQMSWDPQVVARQVAQSDTEVTELEQEIQTKSLGAAYMYRQKLESLLRQKTEAVAAAECTALYGRIAQRVDGLRVEKPKGHSGSLQMLVNLSCLVSHAQLPPLEAELDKVRGMQGFSARLIGPMPPYSFC